MDVNLNKQRDEIRASEVKLHNQMIVTEMMEYAQSIVLEGLSFENLTESHRIQADKIMENANHLKREIADFKKELETNG